MYEGESWPDQWDPEVFDINLPSKDEDKFPKLTYTKIEFCILKKYQLHCEPDSPVDLLDLAVKNIKKYLTAKCPNLKKPIQIRNGELPNQVVFESNGLEDSYKYAPVFYAKKLNDVEDSDDSDDWKYGGPWY